MFSRTRPSPAKETRVHCGPQRAICKNRPSWSFVQGLNKSRLIGRRRGCGVVAHCPSRPPAAPRCSFKSLRAGPARNAQSPPLGPPPRSTRFGAETGPKGPSESLAADAVRGCQSPDAAWAMCTVPGRPRDNAPGCLGIRSGLPPPLPCLPLGPRTAAEAARTHCRRPTLLLRRAGRSYAMMQSGAAAAAAAARRRRLVARVRPRPWWLPWSGAALDGFAAAALAASPLTQASAAPGQAAWSVGCRRRGTVHIAHAASGL